jgi:hypothetical protein
VPGSIYLPDQGRNLILGSTSLPRIGCRQLKGLGGLYYQPTPTLIRRQGMENRCRSQYQTNATSRESARRESSNNGGGSSPR